MEQLTNELVADQNYIRDLNSQSLSHMAIITFFCCPILVLQSWVDSWKSKILNASIGRYITKRGII